MVFGLGWRYCYFYKLRLLKLDCYWPYCCGGWMLGNNKKHEAGQAHIRRHRLGRKSAVYL